MSDPDDSTALIRQLQALLPELKHRYGVRTLAVFGSRASATAGADSDLDIMVTFEETPGFLEFVRLENFLTDSLGVKVDLVMERALKPRIKPRILEQAIAL
jgi:predicted nucleotidyltransferase